MSKCREVAGCIRTRRGEDAGPGRRGFLWVALISPNDFVCPEIRLQNKLSTRGYNIFPQAVARSQNMD
jgi:hypothetical protein